jgi:membrane fusion protein (multidrug efflux system)
MKGRKLVLGIFGVVGLVVLGYGIFAWYRSSFQVATDDAYVEGPIAVISPKVPGQVLEVLVTDNQAVKRGQVLVRLDARDYQLRLDQARAAVSIAQSRHRAAVERVSLGRDTAHGQATQARASIMSAESAQQTARDALETGRATVAARRAALASIRADADRTHAMAERAVQDLRRTRELVAKDLISRQELDHAETEARASEATANAAAQRVIQAERDLAVAESELKAREAGYEPNTVGIRMADARALDARARQIQAEALVQEVKVREAERDLAAAQLREAEANVQMAELNLEYAQLKAPADGVAAKKNVEVGQIVQAGQPLLAVVPLHEVWVVANFKETQLTRVRPGMKAKVEVDSYPGRAFTGVVESISAGTGSRFSLLPPENATGNWVKVVQRVPVKVTLDPKEFSNPHILRAGMSALVTIDVR